MSQDNTLKERTSKLISKISAGLLEREETVALALLAVLAGQSVFLYGPPGTAKSLIAHRISLAFKDSKFFEYLMNRFSTPEEVFGPVSIKELKEDRYIRKTKGYLPEADIAFLDEIWKSSPAILNTLLTIINERKFRNGDQVLNVPLKGIIAASNEIPLKNQGLEALYDRFIMRLSVTPMTERKNFESLLKDTPTNTNLNVDEELKFDEESWKETLDLVNRVKISEESLNIIHSIRVKIDEWNNNEKNDSKIYISDRRWQKMAGILKTAAYLCDRDSVKPVDTLILKNCLWTEIENKKDLSKIIEDSVREFCLFDFEKFDQWCENLESLKKEIEETFFYESDKYTVENIDGQNYLKVSLTIPYIKQDPRNWNRVVSQKNLNAYLPFDKFQTKGKFTALNESHEELSSFGALSNYMTDIEFDFQGTSTCQVSYYCPEPEFYYSRKNKSSQTILIEPCFKKGDCKKVPSNVKSMYKNMIEDLLKKHDSLESEINSFYESAKQENKTPFVNSKDQTIVTAAIEAFQKEMNIKKLDAIQLQQKLKNHID